MRILRSEDFYNHQDTGYEEPQSIVLKSALQTRWESTDFPLNLMPKDPSTFSVWGIAPLDINSTVPASRWGDVDEVTISDSDPGWDEKRVWSVMKKVKEQRLSQLILAGHKPSTRKAPWLEKWEGSNVQAPCASLWPSPILPVGMMSQGAQSVEHCKYISAYVQKSSLWPPTHRKSCSIYIRSLVYIRNPTNSGINRRKSCMSPMILRQAVQDC